MKIGLSSIDIASISLQFRDNRPFSHIVLDDVLTPAHLAALQRDCDALPWAPHHDEIVLAMTAAPPEDSAIAELLAWLAAPEQLRDFGAMVGRELTDVTLQPWRYVRQCYLLPHTDADPRYDRALAFVLHISVENPVRGALVGGDLVLYEASESRWQPAKHVATQPGRLVLFEPTVQALHAVDEVRSGDRMTLTGWFLGPEGARHLASLTPLPPRSPRYAMTDLAESEGDSDSDSDSKDATARFTAARRRVGPLLRRFDMPQQARCWTAPADLDDALVVDLAAWANTAFGEAITPTRARWLRLQAGDYTLRRDDQLQRTPTEVAHAVLDFSAMAHGVGLTTWQRGSFAVLAQAQAPGERVVVAREAGLDFWQHYISLNYQEADVWRLEVGFSG